MIRYDAQTTLSRHEAEAAARVSLAIQVSGFRTAHADLQQIVRALREARQRVAVAGQQISGTYRVVTHAMPIVMGLITGLLLIVLAKLYGR